MTRARTRAPTWLFQRIKHEPGSMPGGSRTMTIALISSRALTLFAALLATNAVFAAEMDMGKAKSMTMPMTAMAAKPAAYRFELASPPKSLGGGKSLVAVKLMHNGKPVTGAIIIQSRADMGP